MSKRTNVQRFDGAVKYIRDHVSAVLAGKFGGENKEIAGAQISLSSAGFAFSGSESQHWAVRAILLCQYKFLGADALPAQAKLYFKTKTELQIQEHIRAYTVDAPSKEKLASKAELYAYVAGKPAWYERTRADGRFGGNAIICYTGVTLWLFQAGYVTLKWFKDNQNMNANNCNAVLGHGVAWDLDRMNDIPRGMIWNFQGYRKEVCHWGISLGRGNAAGTNNQEEERGKKVDFETGGLVYGRFTLSSQYEVLKLKYSEAETKDPRGGATDFIKVTGVETKLFVIDPDLIAFADI